MAGTTHILLGKMRFPWLTRFFCRLLWHSVQSRLLDPARLPPLLRTIRAAVFPNNAPGTPGLVAPSSDEELAALRRRCASAVWAVVPKVVGKLYFGSSSPFRASLSSSSPRPTSTTAGTKTTSGNLDKTSAKAPLRSGPPITSVAANSETNSSSTTTASGSSNSSSAKTDPLPSAAKSEAPGHARVAKLGSSNESNVTSAANSRDHVRATKDAAFGADDVVVMKKAGGADNGRAAAAATDRPSPAPVNAGVDGFAPDSTPLQYHEDEDRILSEIETGILDVFSDAYCNKHLMYGVLELIFVRLMPELAERGVIDLWEERLS